jgi:uncharacterized protein HemX
MSFLQSLIQNKILAMILAVLVVGFGGIFLHWQQEENAKQQAAKEELKQAEARQAIRHKELVKDLDEIFHK